MFEEYVGYAWSMYIVSFFLGAAAATVGFIIWLVLDANRKARR